MEESTNSQGMAQGEDEVSFDDGPQDIGDFRDRIRAVCLIKNKKSKKRGSGFLSKVSVDDTGEIYGIFTCSHVLGSKSEAETADVFFDYEGKMAGEKVKLKPEVKFLHDEVLDYAFIAVDMEDIANLKCCAGNQIQPIIMEPKLEAKKGDKVIIVQHPGGQPKKWSSDKISRIEKPFVFHKSDTEGGSSGSPVFTYNGYKLIAIHKGFKKDLNRGTRNKGTLCCEVLKHITTGNYTQPGGAKGSSKNPGLKRKKDEKGDVEVYSKETKKRKLQVKDGCPTRNELEGLSRKIVKDWESLGHQLGYDDDALAAFDMDNARSVSKKAYTLLMAWNQRDAADATYQVLYKALCHEHVNRRDLGEKFCCY